MNKTQLENQLGFLVDTANEIGLVMYFVLKDGDAFTIRKADINAEAMTSLRDQFVKHIIATLIENDDLHLADLTTADNRKNAVYSFDLAELPAGLRVMGELLKNQKAKTFNFKHDPYKNIFGFVFLLGNETKKLAIFKKQYPINLLGRDVAVRLVIKDVKSKTRLVEVNEDIINVNETFDFMQLGDDVIIVNVNTLEKYFGFEDFIRATATSNLEIIKAANLVVDVTPLKEMATELKFAKKLMRVKSDSAVLGLPFNKVRSFIQQHPKLKRRMRFDVGETRILLDTKTSKQLFLKLLDDDFLKSDLTDFLYEAEIKDRLSADEVSD